MGINLNNDTERQYDFNSPSDRGGPGGGYHYGTGFTDTCEYFGTGFNEAPAPGGGPPRRRMKLPPQAEVRRADECPLFSACWPVCLP